MKAFRKGHTLIELVVSAAISLVVFATLFSLILSLSGIAESAYIAHERKLCAASVLDPLISRMERALDIVLADSDDDGKALAVLLSENGGKTLICSSDISFAYDKTEYTAVCKENEVCFQSFLHDGESAERMVLKNISERINIDGLEFYCVNKEKGVFRVCLLMSASGKKLSSEERYVCAFAM